MQRCKKNREDPSRVICFHLLSFLLCAVDLEDLDTPLTWSSSRVRGVALRWSMAQHVQLTPLTEPAQTGQEIENEGPAQRLQERCFPGPDSHFGY